MTRNDGTLPSRPAAAAAAGNSNSTTPTSSDNYIRINADLLIPGRGDPIKHATLICGLPTCKDHSSRGKILYAGPQSALPSKYTALPATTTVPILMPGLWDCHVHYFGLDSLFLSRVATLPPSLAGMRCARDVALTLSAGFTSVREVGGYGIDFSRAIDEGYLPGPKIYSAGAPLSQTAGHGDLHDLPVGLMHCKSAEGVPLQLCDGVEEAVKAVRLQIRRGAKCIKICSTGGVLSKIDSPRAAQFNRGELEAMVEEATRTGLAVASHAHGTGGIVAALRAGVHTIEHGSYLDGEAIELMREKGAMLVATRLIQTVGVRDPEGMPPESYAKILEVERANFKSYQAAIKANVRCALGTDLGVSSATAPLQHGMNGREFALAVEAGMTPLQAIECGTANAPDTLGPQAPKSGQLKEGFDADFIALEVNPVEHIEVLGQPEKVTHVWKGGRVFKAPGMPVGFF